MKKFGFLFGVLGGVAAAGGGQLVPSELNQLVAARERVTVIDLRPLPAYQKGTLPNAVHMSVREALEKKFGGRVVFFDDGLGVHRARRAVEVFSDKGKDADELVGGYAAWKDAGFLTSEKAGLTDKRQRYVTYQELTGALVEDAADIVLVDARTNAPAVQPSERTAASSAAPASESGMANAPVDLAEALPGYRVLRYPAGAASASSSGRSVAAVSVADESSAQPLYIVIDSGDGTAEKTAASLRASGKARVSVLAGGESIIRRKGQPGLIRRGPGTGLAGTSGPGKNQAVVSEEGAP